jgi:hypothetical protein
MLEFTKDQAFSQKQSRWQDISPVAFGHRLGFPEA